MVHAQCRDMLNHTSTSLTQTASSTMEHIQTYYMLKLDPVTGRQTLTDTLADAACTNQLKCYLKWISAFHTGEYVSAVKYYRIIVPTSVYLCRLHM